MGITTSIIMAPITNKKAKAAKKFVVDTSAPVENGVFDQEGYVKYLIEHIKVGNIVGNLGDEISVTSEGNKVVVASNTKFSGKYLKYLKKNQIRDWIRFVAVKQNQYRLQFYSVAEDDE